MFLCLELSPWRRIGSTEAEAGTVHVEILMDLDFADAWMQVLHEGDGVRIECAGLQEIEGEMRATGTKIQDEPTLDAAGIHAGLN
ncbi:MAG: hypothetical protein H0V17_00645 [Deltaproteobacteria bacterium]|nr:hypothetical protein [Deltaproteobacteria bacterium]